MPDRIDKDPQAGSAEAWLLALEKELDAARSDVDLYENYYAGRHELQFATSKFRETFGNLFSEFADNWCEIIVDASVERLEVVGFRFGEERDADQAAWDLWQANDLDAGSDMLFTEMGKHGRAYLLVQPGRDERWPQITPEHPSQVIVRHAPGNRRQRLAALKKWQADDGRLMATVYLPDEIVKFATEEEAGDAPTGLGSEPKWTYREGTRAESVERNPLGVVPVVPVYNRPSLLIDGISDLAPAVDLNNAINKLFLDGIIASEYAAFRQRLLTGVEIPTDENGKEVDPELFLSSVSRIWTIPEGENVGVHEFSATDLNNYVAFIEMIVMHLAAQTRTPPHYLLAKLVNMAPDGLLVAERGLGFKVRRKKRGSKDALIEAQRLAFKLRDSSGDSERAATADAEVIWGLTDGQTLAQLVDAAVKLHQSLEVPLEACWELVGMTPKQIQQLRRAKELAPAPDPAP